MAPSLRALIEQAVAKTFAEAPPAASPVLLWCDPLGAWTPILERIAPDSDWVLVVHEGTELALSSRLGRPVKEPQVVVVGLCERDFSFLRPLVPRLAGVFDTPLGLFLQQNGILVPKDLDPAHAERVLAAAVAASPDSPVDKLFSGQAAGLPDAKSILRVLARGQGEYERCIAQRGLADSFVRRVTVDFGLPEPSGASLDHWRVEAVAALVATDAARAYPLVQPPDTSRVISADPARTAAMDLLEDWRDSLALSPHLEQLIVRADMVLGMAQWAAAVDLPSEPVVSKQAEEVFFTRMIDAATASEDIKATASSLASLDSSLRAHAEAFWAHDDRVEPIPWTRFLALAGSAKVLLSCLNVQNDWKTTADAVAWYTGGGWRMDSAGETLFAESYAMPSSLTSLQARCRKLFLRMTDDIGRAFSTLLEKSGPRIEEPKSAGERLEAYLGSHEGESAAIVFLDGLRYDVGARLAERLNDHEERGSVWTACAPLPSITPLGMAAALPREGGSRLSVEFDTAGRAWSVREDERSENLGTAAGRREWLKDKLGVDGFFDVNDVVEGRVSKAKPGRKVVVFGNDLDAEGHDGVLEIHGAEEILNRYEALVRRLREAGYRLTVCVTDHGFFHWQPDNTEVIEKPGGTILYESRRAIAGRNLTHGTALVFDVDGSDLQVAIPRSVGAFKAYGAASGYFHGGATLQELVIPVVCFRWPSATRKMDVALAGEFDEISSQRPRVKLVSPQGSLFGPGENTLPRSVVVKIYNPADGMVVFRHDGTVTISPERESADLVLRLIDETPVLARGTELEVRVLDADTEERLDARKVQLMIDIDDW